MWGFFCESHRQKLLKTIARLDHSHIMRAPVNGYRERSRNVIRRAQVRDRDLARSTAAQQYRSVQSNYTAGCQGLNLGLAVTDL
jgi:hypothetical protein